MQKLKLHSPDLTQANIEKIGAMFPGCIVEARDDKGVVTHSIDFDQLRQELSGSIVEGPQERYQLNWPGKREALLTANAPIAKTLRPCREESVDFDTTQNLFIEGDNLDALKLLQETYLNKVKMIYIDPPYNTGNDFIYDDDFSESIESYKLKSNSVDEYKNRLIENTDANGRFHSDWLSMISGRIRLCKNLLSDSGVFFVSIDDNERDNIKKVIDEIFGEANFIASIIWRKKSSPDARSTIGSVHDYLLCYVKNSELPKLAIGKMALSENRKASFLNPDSDSRGPWASVDMTGMTGRATKDQYFTVKLPSGREVIPPPGRSWGLIEKTFKDLRSDNRIWFGTSGDNVPRVKRFLSEVDGQTVMTYWGADEVGSNEDASNELLELFGHPKLFDTPKPTRLIDRLLEIATKKNESHIVLDFFAGSATTAHSVFKANLKDAGNRRFILVQAAEPVSEKSEAKKIGYSDVAEISKQRIRLAGEKIKQDGFGDSDTGFRVFKVDSSNMKEVFYTPDAVSQDLLSDQINNIREDRTAEDLLFQVLLDWGVDLALPIAQETIAGKTVYFVDSNALAACFDEDVNEEFVKLLAQREPLRVVFRDSGFASDSVKINVEQIFKLMSPSTEVKCI